MQKANVTTAVKAKITKILPADLLKHQKKVVNNVVVNTNVVKSQSPIKVVVVETHKLNNVSANHTIKPISSADIKVKNNRGSSKIKTEKMKVADEELKSMISNIMGSIQPPALNEVGSKTNASVQVVSVVISDKNAT